MILSLVFWAVVVGTFVGVLWLFWAVDAPVFGAFVGLAAAWFVGFCGYHISIEATTEYYEMDKVALKSLERGDESRGDYFLFAGHSGSYATYQFYARTGPNNTYRLVTVPVQDSAVTEVDGAGPFAVCHRILGDTPWPFGEDVQDFLGVDQIQEADACVFFVPEGSVSGTIEP